MAPRLPACSLPFLFHMLSRNVMFIFPSVLPRIFLFHPLPTSPLSRPPPPSTLLLPLSPFSSASSWFIPFVGHRGICTSSGVIWDFVGPYFVSRSVCVCVCVCMRACLSVCLCLSVSVCGVWVWGCMWLVRVWMWVCAYIRQHGSAVYIGMVVVVCIP